MTSLWPTGAHMTVWISLRSRARWSSLPETARLETMGLLSCGGEAVPSAVYRKWHVGRKFFNAYGPTETTALSIVQHCTAELAAGESYAGATVVVTVTGHGLKDTATALESFSDIVDTVVDADVAAAAVAAGLA